jgi:hypothetical protein
MTSYLQEEFNKFKQCNKDYYISNTDDKFSIRINDRSWAFNKKDFDHRLLDYMDRNLGRCHSCKDYCGKWFLIIRKKIK